MSRVFDFVRAREAVTEKRRLAYVARMKTVRATLFRLEESQVRAVAELYRELRRKIEAALVNATGYDAFHLREIEAGINTAILDFQDRYAAVLVKGQKESYEQGGETVIEGIKNVRTMIPFPMVDPSTVNVLAQFSIDLARGLSEQIRKDVLAELRLGAVGGKSIYQVQQAIAAKLQPINVVRTVNGKQVRQKIGPAYRAEMITRTEIGRAYSLGTQAKIEHIAESKDRLASMGITVKKVWIATIDDRTRPDHAEADGQIVGIDEPFKVGGIEMLFPRDPNAPPEQTCNCRCGHGTVTELGEEAA